MYLKNGKSSMKNKITEDLINCGNGRKEPWRESFKIIYEI